jgi:hypothetical protein
MWMLWVVFGVAWRFASWVLACLSVFVLLPVRALRAQPCVFPYVPSNSWALRADGYYTLSAGPRMSLP